MGNDYTVILNGFKRPHSLKEQVDALNNQTIKPTNILYWQNSIPGVAYDTETSTKLISSYACTNFGVWARFAYALNARTNWVMVFDDDTIPGSQWAENCFNTFDKTPDAGLLGTIGVLFNHKDYGFHKRIGWDNPNENVECVDILGHNWVFHRDNLSVFWRELPPIDHDFISGEDIHFSYMIQKYTNLKSYVPPHPKDNKNMWGSLHGWRLGGDENATAGNGGIPCMARYLRRCCDSGFKLILEGTEFFINK